MKSEIRSRFNLNIQRVRRLVSVYGDRSGKGKGRRPVSDADLLRAATVFLHATLEDFLRSIARWRLPSASEQVLTGIPLVGRARGEKYSLADLVDHARSRKTVEEVIVESVHAHLEQATYNSTDDVAILLASIGVDVATVNSRFSELQALMKRRHHIVHRADASLAKGSGHHTAKSIATHHVNPWIEAVDEFASAVLDRL